MPAWSRLARGAMVAALALIAFIGSGASASSAPPLAVGLADIGFLVGDWSSGTGKVAETGGTATGRSRITIEAGGAVLLRRDHTELADAGGKPAGGFDQIMMIWPEAGTLHADYSDGRHVIHYVRADVVAGKSVVFTSAPGAGPVFRLEYRQSAPDRLAVAFGMTPPGASAVQPIASGELVRQP